MTKVSPTLLPRPYFKTELDYLVYLGDLRLRLDEEFRIAARRFTDKLRREAKEQERA